MVTAMYEVCMYIYCVYKTDTFKEKNENLSSKNAPARSKFPALFFQKSFTFTRFNVSVSFRFLQWFMNYY